MGTNLQVQNLTAEDFGGKEYEGCNEYLVHTKPEAVANVHRGFLEAGADVIETDTFGALFIVFSPSTIWQTKHIISTKLSRTCQGYRRRIYTPEKPRFVAGSIRARHQIGHIRTH